MRGWLRRTLRWGAFSALALLVLIEKVLPIGSRMSRGTGVALILTGTAGSGLLLTAHQTSFWIWVALMVGVSVSAFFVHEIRLWGPWSPIHLLAIFTLVMLPLAVLHARRHAVERHRNAMVSIFLGALVIAGLFTFMPGRIMHAVVFGL